MWDLRWTQKRWQHNGTLFEDQLRKWVWEGLSCSSPVFHLEMGDPCNDGICGNNGNSLQGFAAMFVCPRTLVIAFHWWNKCLSKIRIKVIAIDKSLSFRTHTKTSGYSALYELYLTLIWRASCRQIPLVAILQCHCPLQLYSNGHHQEWTTWWSRRRKVLGPFQNQKNYTVENKRDNEELIFLLSNSMVTLTWK